MGSKGEINKGDFRRDHNNITWVTYKSTEDDSDIDYIEKECQKENPNIRN